MVEWMGKGYWRIWLMEEPREGSRWEPVTRRESSRRGWRWMAWRVGTMRPNSARVPVRKVMRRGEDLGIEGIVIGNN
jgi:hypothetical protein